MTNYSRYSRRARFYSTHHRRIDRHPVALAEIAIALGLYSRVGGALLGFAKYANAERKARP